MIIIDYLYFFMRYIGLFINKATQFFFACFLYFLKKLGALVASTSLFQSFSPVWGRVKKTYIAFSFYINHRLPKRLYTRAILIILLPMVLLQAVIAYVFMDRYWQAVTTRLSASLSREIAVIIDLYHTIEDTNQIEQIVEKRFNINIDFLDPEPLPAPHHQPFFDILHQILLGELSQRIKDPFWLGTTGSSSMLEIRVLLPPSRKNLLVVDAEAPPYARIENKVEKEGGALLRVFVRRSQAYASNSHIFLVWVAGTSLVLSLIAILLLRNQIRQILNLADAAEAFGKGRDVHYRPRGAHEVRRAGLAFLEMKKRIERAIEQRTTMLNGVSHDLRTILTRFRLSLALLPENAEVEDLRRDVEEMAQMLEAYLTFARGEAAENAEPTNLHHLLAEFCADAERSGHFVTLKLEGDPMINVRPQAFRRLLGNLVSNAARYADTIEIHALHDETYLTLLVDDDGPGIPEDMREEVFKPFLRLDPARNQDHAGSGLGLAIARDIARGHGGNVTLEDSPLGGLRAKVVVPA